jgi:hypothetical protein
MRRLRLRSEPRSTKSYEINTWVSCDFVDRVISWTVIGIGNYLVRVISWTVIGIGNYLVSCDFVDCHWHWQLSSSCDFVDHISSVEW